MSWMKKIRNRSFDHAAGAAIHATSAADALPVVVVCSVAGRESSSGIIGCLWPALALPCTDVGR